MVCNKKFIPMILSVCLCGCSTVPAEQRSVYEQGYRAGVKEQMSEIVSKFQGGNFPYYHWAEPIVQEVAIPAHIEHGLFIPEHKELVIIKPGEWAKSPAYPIQTQEIKTHEENSHTDIADITVMPTGKR